MAGSLTTNPSTGRTYVLAYRNDRGLDLKGLDDPRAEGLKIGVFQTSGMREALAKHGVVNTRCTRSPTTPTSSPSTSPGSRSSRWSNGKLDVAERGGRSPVG